MNDFDAKLGIYSKQNILTERLSSKFNDKYVEVDVFDSSKYFNTNDYNYLIINLLNDQYFRFVDAINDVKNIVSKSECKVLVLMPLYVKDEEKYVFESNIQNLLELNKNIGIMLVPEILGSGVKFNDKYVSHDLIMQTLVSERCKIKNYGTLLNTISIGKLIEKIVKETFSFGISGQVLALVGPRKGLKTIVTKYLGVGESNVIYLKDEPKFTEVSHTAISKVDFSLRLAINATRNTFMESVSKEDVEAILPSRSQLLEPDIEEVVIKKSIKSNTKKVFKRLTAVFIFILLLFIAPFVALSFSIFLFYLSVRVAVSNPNLSEAFINYSLKTLSISQNINLGVPFYYNYSNIVYKSAFIFKEVFELSKTGSALAQKVMSDTVQDLSQQTDSMSSILDRIHTDIGFLQSDIAELNDPMGRKINDYILRKQIDVGKYKSKVYFIKNFTSRLSTLLGVNKPAKYLILFQNNMELRPTGGFIGSFALMTFDKGRLTSIEVSDVYQADGQLKGHVDPPEPIRQHLGEGGWYLRDSNWDPSFPDAATKAEWFLDKELNTNVDGVMAIDLSFVQKLLKVTGPLTLNDFNKTINSENLYITTQNEVESDFFPGSIKKASFMTSLSRELITAVENLPSSKYFNLLESIYSSFEERHIQMYFHDLNAQESVINLGYGGEVNMNTDCGLRCFNDKYALVDANLGVNKSNYFINRSHGLNVSVKKDQIGHELFVTYTNTASQALGNMGVYKNYSRLLLPLNAEVSGLRLYDKSGSYEDVKFDKTIVNDRQEIGFLINILPGDSKRVQAVWNLKTDALSNGGEYRVDVRKQAGTDNDQFSLNIEKTDLSLTGRVPSVYTTTLARDFSARLFFKP